jgi:hypothetical protein
MLDAEDFELVKERLFADADLVGVESLRGALSSVWIASGLAKISALHGAQLLNKLVGTPARFMTAVEYAQNTRVQCLPILTSLRGNHPDAQGVATAIANRDSHRGILLTADPLGFAAQLLGKPNGQYDIRSCALPDRDRRFVNCKSILALSALTQRLVLQAIGESGLMPDAARITLAWERAQHHIHTCGIVLRQFDAMVDPHVIILSDGMLSDLSVTWQSILSEAGVVTPICLDIKDYTHGDHLAAVRTGNVVYIVLSRESTWDICRIFSHRFSSLYPVINVDLAGDVVHSFWENLFTACSLTSLWSEIFGLAGQRPPKHPIVSAWRGWGEL